MSWPSDVHHDESRRAEAFGIVPEFYEISGVRHETSAATRAALLAAMGVGPHDTAPAEANVWVVRQGDTPGVGSGELTFEDGTTTPLAGALPPDLPLGYHDILFYDDEGASQHKVRLIVAPRQCPFDPQMRIWGWGVQLYAARSTASWGLGDFADLRRLGHWSRQLGAGCLLVNPLVAVAPVPQQQSSPYSPSSRRFRNPLYLRIEEVPGAATLGADLDSLAAHGRALNGQARIDRDAVFRLKMAALERLWPGQRAEPALAAFERQQGRGLAMFATFCALAEKFGGDYRQWPAEFRRPDAPAVRQFADEHADRVRFHTWLQWLADEQLARAAAEMVLVQDLPIGVDLGGADAWAWQDVLATGVTVGSPPDQFNPHGQDWGLPPFVPHKLRAARYEPFVETIRAVLRHAGGLRIDHVMGLFRLFWIPTALGARGGTYVRYRADEMLAIVALESHRAGAWVAGEDLGTVEPHVRQDLADHRMMSTKLAWFEPGDPRDYPAVAMAALTTHDLPTVAGLWAGADFRAQERIGLRPDPDGFRSMRDKLKWLTEAPDDLSADEIVRRAHVALARAPSAVLIASLHDALAVEDRPNMPGTIEQWPNWSIALPQPLEVLEQAELPRTLATVLNA